MAGWDEGEMFTDTYDPASFWKSDYRCEVGFSRVGLDEQAHLPRLAMAKQLGGLSTRSFMRLSGLVDNPLNEEREIKLEEITGMLSTFAFAQANSGNIDPAVRYAARIDSDKQTVRQAALDTIADMKAVPSTAGPPESPAGMGDADTMI